MDSRQPEAVPEARLVRRDHRALEVLLQRLEDRHAAKAGARDQDAVGLGGAGGADLGVERFDLLLETRALAVGILGTAKCPLPAVKQTSHGCAVESANVLKRTSRYRLIDHHVDASADRARGSPEGVIKVRGKSNRRRKNDCAAALTFQDCFQFAASMKVRASVGLDVQDLSLIHI